MDLEKSNEQSIQSIQEILENLSTVADLVPGDLATLGQWLASEDRPYPVELYACLCGALQGCDVPLTAYDVAIAGLRHHKRDPKLLWLKALSLCEVCAFDEAKDVLLQLREQPPRPDLKTEDLLGLLARTYRSLAFAFESENQWTANLREASNIYQQAYATSGSFYPAINAATSSAMMGDLSEAQRLAGEAYELCRGQSHNVSTEDDDYYWLPATMAEAALILGRTEEAIMLYHTAAARANKRFRFLRSTRRNARLLMKRLGQCFL